MSEALEELYMPQAEQFGIELRRVGDALVGEVAGETATGAVCVYHVEGMGVVISHRLRVRRDMPFVEHGLPGLCIGALSPDSLDLCPVDVTRGRRGCQALAPASRSAAVAVFGQDRLERSYPLRGGSVQEAVSMTVLPGWIGRWDGELGRAGRELMEGVGETCPEEVAAARAALVRAVTPRFGGGIADGRDVVERVARATEVALVWHRERERAEEASGTLGQARLARAVRHHVVQHLDERLTLDGLARDLLTSRSRLCEAFRAETGESLGAYVKRLRMERAARMLEVPSMSVSEVARAVGYPRASSFVAAFGREFGCSPGAWRVGAACDDRPQPFSLPLNCHQRSGVPG